MSWIYDPAQGNHETCWPGSGDAWNTSSLDSGGECVGASVHEDASH